MPLQPQLPVLSAGFFKLFDPEQAAIETAGAARAWAKAYTDYAVAGGVVAARPREVSLAGALTRAFIPEPPGQGPPFLIQAIVLFWIGQAVPEQLGIVVAVTPAGPILSPQPGTATPQQQADSLAQAVASFTIGSVKVQL